MPRCINELNSGHASSQAPHFEPPLPAIGICEACNSQFKSSKRSQDEAESDIKAAFEAYDCKVREDKRANMRGYMEEI
jgi:hypothetical protein